jgi:hypothetical protein
MLSVKTDEIYGKNDVVNSNDLRKHLINIDSRFRKSYLEPPTDFLYQFAHPYKNVIKARVGSVEIPIGFYNFSKVKKNTMKWIEFSVIKRKENLSFISQFICECLDKLNKTPEVNEQG